MTLWQRFRAAKYTVVYAAALLVVVALLVRSRGDDGESATPEYPAASRAPSSEQGWERWQTEADPAAPQDEPQRGRTASDTPVRPRDEQSFPAETRNLFHDVDQTVGPTGSLAPFDFTDGEFVTADAREAIRGKNSWMLWAGGNDEFWNWLQQHGFGLADFLVLLDSRERATRFEQRGMINQPGMRAQTDPSRKLLGLYLDEADGDAILLKQAENDADSDTRTPARAPSRGDLPFEPGDRTLYDETVRRLPNDGVDPYVYGYPSGVIGLRLMLNPDFFGNTPAASDARKYWQTHVIETENDPFYDEDGDVTSDPNLVRPFRVGMSCAFCHVAPHPLNPPADPAEPLWSNLSSTIGNQYWMPSKIFTNLVKENNFLFQFLASQQPGTVDTSLLSTDHINNSNTINALFNVPARLERAQHNAPEEQSLANLLLPSIEESDHRISPRHTPRMLVDGGDSVGAAASVVRVFLNIGTFSEEWARSQRPIIGFRAQRPFSVASLNANSVYWRTTEQYRVPAILKFLTYENPSTGAYVAPPMPLASAQDDASARLEEEQELATAGREVFLANCAICHSSKQPEGFALEFSDDWESHPGTSTRELTRLVLPRAFADWERFTKTPAYANYVSRIESLAEVPINGRDEFLVDNFLSTDIRVPVTLVGTNSGRAVATNAMRGQVWDNFSSEDYKRLPAVGAVRFYNPYSGAPLDAWGNNDAYYPPGGGPGYYRPPSLIGLWATAPYLHNNALGLFNADPSVAGRLRAFDDGIDKLLWKSLRRPGPRPATGDLRLSNPDLAGDDPGFIYRTTETSYLTIQPKFIRPLFESVLGPFGTRFVTSYLWIALAAGCVVLVFIGRARHAAIAVLLIGIVASILLVISRIDSVYGARLWLGPAATVSIAALLLFWVRDRWRWVARVAFVLLAAVNVVVGVNFNAFTSGRLSTKSSDPSYIKVGPIPKGIPVSLIINASPAADIGDIVNALSALLRGGAKIVHEGLKGEAALKAFEDETGPAMMRINKSPDFVLDRGHWFAEPLSDDEKRQLKAFLRTL